MKKGGDWSKSLGAQYNHGFNFQIDPWQLFVQSISVADTKFLRFHQQNFLLAVFRWQIFELSLAKIHKMFTLRSSKSDQRRQMLKPSANISWPLKFYNVINKRQKVFLRFSNPPFFRTQTLAKQLQLEASENSSSKPDVV